MIDVHREYEGEWQGGLTHWRGSLRWWWKKNMHICIYIFTCIEIRSAYEGDLQGGLMHGPVSLFTCVFVYLNLF